MSLVQGCSEVVTVCGCVPHALYILQQASAFHMITRGLRALPGSFAKYLDIIQADRPLRSEGSAGGLPGDDDDRYSPQRRYHQEEYFPPHMDPHQGRRPSPGHPFEGYQLDDRPYMPDEQPLEIPMGPGPVTHIPGDRLQAQPTVRDVPIVSHDRGVAS